MNRLLPLVLLFAASAVLAESGSYRVEVIVFKNLETMADASLENELRSFSQFPATDEDDLPDDLIVVEEKLSYMDNVWSRLRRSKGYRPLLFAAWEQNRTDYYPPIRIHDDMVLDTQLRPPTNIMIVDPAADDPLGAYMSTFYRLDGTIQLRRSRFLHLYLDLEYREQTPDAEAEATFFGTGGDADPGLAEQTIQGDSHPVFLLQQHRQIHTGSLQYFDTPAFGALVFVSAIPAQGE